MSIYHRFWKELMQIRGLILIGLVSSLSSLQGCTVLTLTEPSDVVKYHSPQEVIDKLKLNGSDGRGREYLIGIHYLNKGFFYQNYTFLPPATREVAPYKVMESYCISQNGFFSKVAEPTGRELTKDPNDVIGTTWVTQKMGTFKCASDTKTWLISIEPLAAKTFLYNQNYEDGKLMSSIILKTSVIDSTPAISR